MPGVDPALVIHDETSVHEIMYYKMMMMMSTVGTPGYNEHRSEASHVSLRDVTD